MMRLVHNQEIGHAKRDGIKKVFVGFQDMGRFILKTNIQTQKNIDTIKPHSCQNPDEGGRR